MRRIWRGIVVRDRRQGAERTYRGCYTLVGHQRQLWMCEQSNQHALRDVVRLFFDTNCPFLRVFSSF